MRICKGLKFLTSSTDTISYRCIKSIIPKNKTQIKAFANETFIARITVVFDPADYLQQRILIIQNCI